MKGRERVMRVLRGEKPDRMPCFGAGSTVTYGQMEAVQAFWPEGHLHAEAMAQQALAAHTVLGFDAVRVPFCLTTEAEALGARITPGDTDELRSLEFPPLYTIDDTPVFPDDFLDRGAIPEILKAVRMLKQEAGEEAAIIGGIVAPLTVVLYLLYTKPMLKVVYRTPEKLLPFLDVAERAGTLLARGLLDAGADIIACEDITATQFLAPARYAEHVLGFQKKQFAALSAPKVLQICGNLNPILEFIAQAKPHVLCVEPKTDIALARKVCGRDTLLMGGVEAMTTLFAGTVEDVKRESEESIARGIQILGPGCAVAPNTPTENLRALVEVARMH